MSERTYGDGEWNDDPISWDLSVFRYAIFGTFMFGELTFGMSNSSTWEAVFGNFLFGTLPFGQGGQ